MSDDPKEFYAKHAAGGQTHVVVAHAERKPEGTDIGIFSTIESAQAWAETLSDDDYHGVIFVPYVVDVPEFGNVPKGARQ